MQTMNIKDVFIYFVCRSQNIAACRAFAEGFLRSRMTHCSQNVILHYEIDLLSRLLLFHIIGHPTLPSAIEGVIPLESRRLLHSPHHGRIVLDCSIQAQQTPKIQFSVAKHAFIALIVH